MTKATKSVIVLGVVLVVMLIAVIGATVARVQMTSSRTEVEEPVIAATAGFPVPSDAQTAIPPYAGIDPPTSTRVWRVTGSLTEACTQWRELFRGWVDQTSQDSVGGEVDAVSCSFSGRKSGMAATLRLARYTADAPIEATLNVTGS